MSSLTVVSRLAVATAAWTALSVLAGCGGSDEKPPTDSGSADSSASAPTPGAQLRFVVASDTHLGEPRTDSETSLRRFVSAVNALDRKRTLDFVVIDGDIAHDAADLPRAKRQLDRLTPRYFPVPGNHDHATPALWRKVFNSSESTVRMVKGTALLLANTSDKAGAYLCVDDRWLTSALRRSASAENVLVFFHITPSRWTRYGVDCPAVRSTLAQQSNLRAVFNGHDHDQVGEKTDAGVHYLFDGRVGGHWGTPHPTYRYVEVRGNRLMSRVVDLLDGSTVSQQALSW